MRNSGFILTELIVVMFIFAVLFGVVTVSLLTVRQKSVTYAPLDLLISDLRSQQLKAMLGDTEGQGGSSNYGIYFSQNSYTLESSNFTVSLDSALQFINITFPSTSVIFAKGSGEVVGFIEGANSLTLKDTVSGEQKTLTINRLGSITQIQ